VQPDVEGQGIPLAVTVVLGLLAIGPPALSLAAAIVERRMARPPEVVDSTPLTIRLAPRTMSNTQTVADTQTVAVEWTRNRLAYFVLTPLYFALGSFVIYLGGAILGLLFFLSALMLLRMGWVMRGESPWQEKRIILVSGGDLSTVDRRCKKALVAAGARFQSLYLAEGASVLEGVTGRPSPDHPGTELLRIRISPDLDQDAYWVEITSQSIRLDIRSRSMTNVANVDRVIQALEA
jgi:hypothetical protein